MLKIKTVTARNFLSIGAQTQAVDFDSGQLTLVIGHNLDLGGDGSRNGVGKTAILNALSYGLYGEALTNIKKDNLINLTNNKNMMVSVDFEVNDTKYRIERGRRPNVLRLFVDGVELEHDEGQGDSRDTQKDIQKIIGFPHEMFKHIVALNTYTEPFLSMRTHEQRAMIEQLLGITELSAKAEVLKELMKQTKDRIREEEITINTIKASNERIEKNISDIDTRAKAWQKSHREKIAEMQEAIDVLEHIDIEAEIAAHRTNTETLAAEQSREVIESEIKQTNRSLQRSIAKIEELEEHLSAALNGVCPACTQATAHLETHEAYTHEVKEKLLAEREYQNSLVEQLNRANLQLSELGPVTKCIDTFYSSVDLAFEHKHNLETLILQLSSKKEEHNPYVEQADSLRANGLQEISFEVINELTVLKDHQDFLYKLLTNKDSFIRKKIIDQNIAYLNHRLSYYLEKMGLPHDVKFNNDLSVEITEYGRDLDFDNLSRGERNRLILSLSWSFRDIYESLNHPMNLLCVDELIDSGLDTTGVENALGVLKKMNRDQNKNIFLISHREELIGRVNHVLTVVKTGGFTEYSNDVESVS